MNDERALELTNELRRIGAFADLPPEQLHWLITHGEAITLKTGDVLFRQGDMANAMYIILEGEYHARADAAGLDARVYVASAGDPASEVSGKLPFSRMTTYGGTGRAVTPTRIISIKEELFPEMLAQIPALGQRLIGVMSDRIREVTKADQQRDKLMALGKLSAGLAHELNNPAAAARRAANILRETLSKMRDADIRLDALNLAHTQREFLVSFERDIAARAEASAPHDSLAQSDVEDEVNAWLDARNIADGWKLAPTLVEAGVDVESLKNLGREIDAGALGDVLARLAAQASVTRLAGEIEASTARISELVGAIKEYTFMDQAPVQDIDLHKGLESTLVILGYKLKQGVRVVRDYDRSLPRINAYGSELNQVWTNLIDNAIDAMHGKGELRIHTARETDNVLVEITDNGLGIPAEIKSRVFEPFFTTKGVGEGTGLGLDTAYRIVHKHHGDIRFDSAPGTTRFQIRLPFSLAHNAALMNSATSEAQA